MCSIAKRSLLRLLAVTPPDVLGLFGDVFDRSVLGVASHVVVAPHELAHAVAERLRVRPAACAVQVGAALLHARLERDLLVDASVRRTLRRVLVDEARPLERQGELLLVRFGHANGLLGMGDVRVRLRAMVASNEREEQR